MKASGRWIVIHPGEFITDGGGLCIRRSKFPAGLREVQGGFEEVEHIHDNNDYFLQSLYKKLLCSYTVATSNVFLIQSILEVFMTDCVIRSRIDPRVKAKAVKLFDHMGLTLSDAIRLFLYQSVAEKRIPFPIQVPNATTLAALQEMKHPKSLEKTSLKQLQKDWDNACEKLSKPSNLKKTTKKSHHQDSIR
jgi:DNA-damage-inducible protein J